MKAKITVKSNGSNGNDKVLTEMYAVISKAINKNGEKTGYKNLHSIYSGFLTYAKQNWKLKKEQVIDNLMQLEAKGLIAQRPWKGGYLIYLAADAKKFAEKSESNKFAKLLAD
jgi:predicted HNH restriction endonuclease